MGRDEMTATAAKRTIGRAARMAEKGRKRTVCVRQLRKFKLDDGMSDSECDQPFVLSRVAAVADD
jgi:hypothetical protein